MESMAILKYARFSAQKARVVVNAIRGLPVREALYILSYSQKRASKTIKKVLESAIANAEFNEGADVDQLNIKTIFVNDGPIQKRINFRAKGRADRILQRMCHITVIVSDHNQNKVEDMQ